MSLFTATWETTLIMTRPLQAFHDSVRSMKLCCQVAAQLRSSVSLCRWASGVPSVDAEDAVDGLGPLQSEEATLASRRREPQAAPPVHGPEALCGLRASHCQVGRPSSHSQSLCHAIMQDMEDCIVLQRMQSVMHKHWGFAQPVARHNGVTVAVACSSFVSNAYGSSMTQAPSVPGHFLWHDLPF